MVINLYIIDIKKIDVDDLLSSRFINKEEIKDLPNKDVYNEKIASLYLKNKYIGEYSFNEYGKPISSRCFFNISHSHGLVILGINDKCEIGVDIEKNKSIEDKYKRYICNDEEYKYIKNDTDFLKIWTNKESLLKCLGVGINKKLSEVNGLPLNDIRNYENKIYRSQTIIYGEYIISITIQSQDNFIIKTNLISGQL